MYCIVQELAMATKSKQTWKKYYKQMEVYVENSVRFRSCFSGFGARRKDSLLLTFFEANFV